MQSRLAHKAGRVSLLIKPINQWKAAGDLGDLRTGENYLYQGVTLLYPDPTSYWEMCDLGQVIQPQSPSFLTYEVRVVRVPVTLLS